MGFFASGDFWGGLFGGGCIIKSLVFIKNNHASVDGLANGDGGLLQAATLAVLDLVHLIII